MKNSDRIANEDTALISFTMLVLVAFLVVLMVGLCNGCAL